jgi:maleate cis-trans isomerase
MFEADTPKHKVGFLSPLSIIDNSAYEFYRLAPPGVMAVMIPIGLSEFSAHDVDRVFEPLDRMLDQLLERGIELTIQAGTPLAVLMGVAAHDKLMAHIEKKTGKPATSTVAAVVRAAKAMKVNKIAFANKWSAQMNKVLAEFFARAGIEAGGAAAKELAPADFVRIPTGDHMRLCYELSKQALKDNPDCDALYIGGGTWLSEPVVRQMEKETDKTIICNQTAQMWDLLHLLNDWKPRQGSSRLMALPD